MDSQLAWVSTIAAVFGVIAYCMIFKKNPFSRTPQRKPSSSVSNSSSVELAKLIDALSSALSDCTILPRDAEPFARSTNAYWAKQESEATPACVIQPRSAQRLGAAVAILKAEHDNRAKRGTKSEDLGLFAVRGGGHSAVSGAASISGGVLIDLGFLNKVTLSEDGASVAIEAGARWMDVSTLLDQKGLAAVGGRNSHVGVGGLTLGGQFYSLYRLSELSSLADVSASPVLLLTGRTSRRSFVFLSSLRLGLLKCHQLRGRTR